MSEHEILPLNSPPPDPQAAAQKTGRLRRFFLRHVPISLAGAFLLFITVLAGAFFWAGTDSFQNLARKRLVARLESATGGRVEIASFHWRLLDLEAEAGGVTIHGLEAPGEAPWAHVESLRVRISLLGLLSPHVVLRELEIVRPAVHLIVYPDGSTSQPHLRRQSNRLQSVLDTVFRLQAGHVAVEQGGINIENRASDFDYQDRRLPLDFTAGNLSLRIAYRAAAAGSAESYRIEAGASDLNLARGKAPHTAIPVVHGRVLATVDLERHALLVRSLRITASSRKAAERSVEASGELDDFAHPRWRVRALGDLDMRLIEPLTGYSRTPEGIAHLDVNAEGQAAKFRIDGGVHVENGAYIGTGVYERGVDLDARVHADIARLLISNIVARLHQGGSIEGTVDLRHWLLPATIIAAAQPAGAAQLHNGKTAGSADANTIPVDGAVKAEFHEVALDTILDMVSQPPFLRLGLDARLNGSASAVWWRGDSQTVEVSSLLHLNPSSAAIAGEAPAAGVVDATYTQRDGAVSLRQLDLSLPGSHLEARGKLGVYPMTSSTAIGIDFASSNLGEFDTALRDLDLKNGIRAGTAALPMALTGQANFHGAWSGSLRRPRLAGALQATGLAIEMPHTGNEPFSEPRFVQMDSVDVEGSYAAERISIGRGVLQRGVTRLTLSGTLDASPGRDPVFDGDSTLHARVEAVKVNVDDVRPLFHAELPVQGVFDARFDADGPLRTAHGSGWLEIAEGRVYGQPMKRLRIQGSVANRVLHADSFAVRVAEGSLNGSGSYDLQSGRFQIQSQGSHIDLARVEWLRRQTVTAAGRLAFHLNGSGTAADPRIAGGATITGLDLAGEKLGDLHLTAHAANRSVFYDATAHPVGAALHAGGSTALDGGYTTHARLELSHFDVGEILKQANVKALGGESVLAGTIVLDGPLAHPNELRGEARMEQLEATVAGVHLKSEGGARATLAGGRIQLEPLHITGEDTNLNAEGALTLGGDHRLDIAASGSFSLKLIQTFDPDVTAAGAATFQIEAHGPLSSPGLRGRLDFQNGSLSLEDVPNGLSQLRGTLEFNRNRLEVRSLTAMSGGGLLSASGYLAYQKGIFANLRVTGKQIRIRYPEGISSLADATLHLQGTPSNMLLSGDVLLTRFTASQDFDITALATKVNAVKTISSSDAPSNHIRLDVHVISSSQLNFQNAFAKLAGDVNLRLRGTLASPSLLGKVSITEGSAVIAGTRYDLEHGDVTFANPLRIDPTIDLSATARVEEYDITLGLHGAMERLSVTYRSDPPLPEADVVALLTMGHTQDQQRIYTQQQQEALSGPATGALLGGALNATVSSRVQKLFGAGSVKVDPNYLGPFGNSTSRVIVQEQVGRNVTLTYATDVNTTGQQLLQAEVAINRHVSLVVARDESGVFSMVVKATRRYR